MTQDIDTYLDKLLEKHSKTVYEDVLIKLASRDVASAILEVEGIIEVLEDLSKDWVGGVYLDVETKITFYKQALLKLRNE